MAIRSTRLRAVLTAGLLCTVLGTGAVIAGAAYPAIAETGPSAEPTPAPTDNTATDEPFDPCPEPMVTITDVTDTGFVLHWSVDESADYTSFELFAPVWKMIPADGSSSYEIPLDGFVAGSYLNVQLGAYCSTHPHWGFASTAFHLTGGDGIDRDYAGTTSGYTNSSASTGGAGSGDGIDDSSGDSGEAAAGSPGTSAAAAAGPESSATAGSASVGGANGTPESIPTATTGVGDPVATPSASTPVALAQTGSESNPILIASGLLLVVVGATAVVITMRTRNRAHN